MQNKASLSLMELLVMILVFSLAAALCLGVFARAQQISQDTARRETGAQIAQNGAELLKSGEALEKLSLPDGYSVEFIPQETDLPGLSLGAVEVQFEEMPVFSVQVAWQEGIE